ncbi:hypothetical protein DRO69_02070 [Candidatus Bathyarchaeota archaeon]|nr:MAG: hypothetical protein DRO69_02070 [Candidatus Bathyarchaeota archaeon]
MSESKPYRLKPISKEEFNKLAPRKTDYTEMINNFLKGNDDIVEVIMPNKKFVTLYAGLKAYAKRHNHPFLVRKREGRIFLLKRRIKNE